MKKTVDSSVDYCTLQMALLKHFAPQHLILGVAYRSINEVDLLKLTNNAYIPRQHKDKIDFPWFVKI